MFIRGCPGRTALCPLSVQGRFLTGTALERAKSPANVCFTAVSIWLRKESLLKKRNVFRMLIYLAALILCVRPLPLNAQSGSSTCQVTATAGEKETPPPGDTGDENNDPTEPGTTAEPEARPTEKPEGSGDGEPETRPTEKPGGPGDGETETEAPKESGEPEKETATPEEKEPELGEAGSTPKPGGGKTPGTEGEKESTGDSGKESQEPQETPMPREEPGDPGTGGDGDTPGEEEEAVQTGEPVPGELPGGHDGYGSLLNWLLIGMLILCLIAALLAGGAFRWLWMLFCFFIFRRSHIRFHGILTEKNCFFIRVKNAEESTGLVQGMIDRAGSFAEFKEEVLKETAFTCIPGQSRMRISCTGWNGRKRDGEMAASERRLFRILEKLEGTGEVEVRIACRGAGIDIPLVFRV